VLPNEEHEEFEPNVGDDVYHDDDIDDIDDDTEMDEFFNVIFEPDDINVELDEEED